MYEVTPKEWFNELRSYLKAKWVCCQRCGYHEHPFHWDEVIEEEEFGTEFLFEGVRCTYEGKCIEGNQYKDILTIEELLRDTTLSSTVRGFLLREKERMKSKNEVSKNFP